MIMNLEIDQDWFLEGAFPAVVLGAEPGPQWCQAYAPLAEQGVGIAYGDLTETTLRKEVSLSFLEPVIEIVPRLSVVTIDRVLDVEVLERASALTNLVLQCNGPLRVDLSRLPLLREYQGRVTAGTASVLANPHLERLELTGRTPKKLPAIAAPLTTYRQIGGTPELPEFLHPERLTEVERAGSRTFDLTILRQFEQLQRFRLERCPDVTNVREIDSLRHLDSIVLQNCTTSESWANFTPPRHGYLTGLRPPLPKEFAARLHQLGWATDTA
ncbi:hypothetical protein DEA06_10890 [Microbacterium sp. Gd 4-13]|uniref:hypothetical protein n=1 Tax=Microbacterium sp. Gd 4-13 TaxID=2173179 RepID=UPI000D57F826|nr:hypothetical protein [Microbacterium sp. Gd 4-13]PVW03871.1 hypothetical protein DEA06_10890 [Microbacterium sp. Gd 4-13]